MKGKGMKFISWNIDSLNAALTGTSDRSELTRDVIKTITDEKPDFIAIQETKLPEGGMNAKQEAAFEEAFPGYAYTCVSSAPPARKGYAGTMMLYRKNLGTIAAVSGGSDGRISLGDGLAAELPVIGAPDTMDNEGRLITLETEKFYFNTVYTPNAGDGLKRLSDRQVWDKQYTKYLQELDRKKPVIACGDFNCAHEEIDLKNPDTNHMSAGFTDEERAGFSNLLSAGFSDTFRELHPGQGGLYSWWAQRIRQAKANNAGWRIDYFLVSSRLMEKVTRSEMLSSGPRADHCPIVLELDI